MTSHELQFQQYLIRRHSECDIQRARLQNLEAEMVGQLEQVRNALTRIDEEEDMICNAQARIQELASLNPCSTGAQIPLGQAYLQDPDDPDYTRGCTVRQQVKREIMEECLCLDKIFS